MGKDKMVAKEIDPNSSGSGSGESNCSLKHGREDSHIDNADAQSSKRMRYSGHTTLQIHEMEAVFKVSPHPSDEQRRELSLKLGMEPLQIELWFQNKHNQMKFEHQESIQLQIANERLRAEIKMYREALSGPAACVACGRPLGVEEISCEEYRLRTENARLRAEIGLMSRVAAHIGKPFPPP